MLALDHSLLFWKNLQEGEIKMKRKKNWVINILAIFVSVVIMSCLGPNILAGKLYAGSYGGECEAETGFGSWTFTIDSSGYLKGYFQMPSIESCSGSIDTDGSFRGSGKMKLKELPFTITGKISSDNKVTGTVMVKDLPAVSFSGNKK